MGLGAWEVRCARRACWGKPSPDQKPEGVCASEQNEGTCGFDLARRSWATIWETALGGVFPWKMSKAEIQIDGWENNKLGRRQD